MKPLAAAAIVGLGAVACSQRVATGPRGAAPPGGVAATMQRQVRNAVDAGDGDLRVRALRQRMAAEPENLPVRLELAQYYEQLGYPELAAEHYRLACSRFPDAAEPHSRLAQSLRMAAAPREAIELLEGWLTKHPEGPADLYAWLGILNDEQQRWPQAERAYRAALALEPNRSPLHNNLGYSYLLQGRQGEAAAEFRRALELEPRSEIARNNLGLALAADPREAVRHWQSAGGPAAAHTNMAAVFIEQGRYAEARRELAAALAAQRNYPAAMENLRLLSDLDGRPPEVRLPAASTFWARLWAALRVIFVASEQKSAAGTVETASRQGKE